MEKVTLTPHQKKRIDSIELLNALERIPEEEKYKIFYMVKGIELLHKNEQNSNTSSA